MRRVLLLAVALSFTATTFGQDAVVKEMKRFVGTWKVQSVKVSGKELPRRDDDDSQVAYDAEGGWQQRSYNETIYSGNITALDTGAKFKTLDYKVVKGGTETGKTIRAIYEFVDEDTYRVCYSGPDRDRPLL